MPLPPTVIRGGQDLHWACQQQCNLGVINLDLERKWERSLPPGAILTGPHLYPSKSLEARGLIRMVLLTYETGVINVFFSERYFKSDGKIFQSTHAPGMAPSFILSISQNLS